MKLFSLIFLLFSCKSFAVTCPEDQYWVNAHHRKAYVRSDGRTFKATSVKAHCRSKSAIYLKWSKRLNDNAPKVWPHTSEKFKPWTEEEKQRVLDALELLPEHLRNVNTENIHRAINSRDYPNPATSADGLVVIYDTAFTNKAGLEQILGHELAHQQYEDLSVTEKKDYGYAANWIELGPDSNRYISRKDGYVQDDGRESPEEDYANNIEFYLFKPETLKKLTPQAYRWIKNKYGDNFKISKEGK